MDIYVGNLSYNSTDNSLRDAFAAFGTVESANIIQDRETGRSKGFAFVKMANNDEANAVIEALNGAEIDGRAVKVNEARPREERPPRRENNFRSNSGGGGGGGRRRF
jgi:RNA recognition motif-containing protein